MIKIFLTIISVLVLYGCNDRDVVPIEETVIIKWHHGGGIETSYDPFIVTIHPDTWGVSMGDGNIHHITRECYESLEVGGILDCR